MKQYEQVMEKLLCDLHEIKLHPAYQLYHSRRVPSSRADVHRYNMLIATQLRKAEKKIELWIAVHDIEKARHV